jgi:hypothetical protein
MYRPGWSAPGNPDNDDYSQDECQRCSKTHSVYPPVSPWNCPVPAERVSILHEQVVRIKPAIAWANFTGTAFPSCLYRWSRGPLSKNLGGKV